MTGGGGGGGGSGSTAVFTDENLVPLPVISLSVSLIALLIHWGLAVFIAELRSLYGRYIMTVLTLHVIGNLLQLLAGGLERLGQPSRQQVSLAVSCAGAHFCQLLTATFSLASAVTLWREERRQARRQALIRVLSFRRYARCLALCALFSGLIVGLGLFSSLHQTRWSPHLLANGLSTPATPTRNHSNNTGGAHHAAPVNSNNNNNNNNNQNDWRSTVEPFTRLLDPGYTRISLIFVYRDRNCTGQPQPQQPQQPQQKPDSVVAAYAAMLAGPVLLLYALHLAPLIHLGRIVDSMVEERRLSNRTRASINSFLLLGKFSASSTVVWVSALLSLLLNPACDGLGLWYAYYMLQALQSIFLCISCLFARAPIEILMRRFARKRDDAKLESGLGLLAAVMHSKRKNKSIRPGRGSRKHWGENELQQQQQQVTS